jgi:CubicO group peptidase (beta-lactamase class C family)
VSTSRRGRIATGAVVALWLLASPAIAGVLESRLPPETTASVDRTFADWIAPGEPGGVVLLTRAGQTVFRGAYGMASVELGVAAGPAHVYQIGSLTKQFTAAATLMLIDQGRLRLESTVGQLLPDFPPASRGITIEELLGHTSGLPNVANLPEWAASWGREARPDELIDLFRRRPLTAAPGTEFEYNNSGYLLLGRILERVSGLPYADFVRQRIFEPLGMRSSSYNDWNAIVPGRVPGYGRTAAGWQSARSTVHPSQFYAAGALLSTVDDLARFQRALGAGELFSQELLERMTSPGRLADGRATGYGFGWGVSTQQGRRVLEHGGASNGYYGAVVWLPEAEVWGAVLTNRYGFGDHARALLLDAAKAAAGWPERETPRALPSAALDAFVGLYRAAGSPAEWIEVRRDGDHLLTRRAGEEAPLEAFPRGPAEFFRAARPELLRFRADGPTGGFELVTVVPYLGERIWVRSAAAPDPAAAGAAQPAFTPAADLAIYAGRYELAPGLVAEVLAEGGRLLVNVLGYQRVELTQVGEHEFALPLVFGRLRFRVVNGRATALVFVQEGASEMTGERIGD